MADFLEQKKKEIQERLDELRPLVEEFHKLEAAQRALDGVGSERQSAPAASRRRTGGSGNGAGGGTGRRGRPKGSGTRAAEALQLVSDNPGITIPDMAQKMGIQQNYLYRVLPGLEQEGKVRKEGRGWFAKGD
jgi:predicted Rossmann fold nucleotide-binding protein DprA/Smf involved in DNA uptake